MKAAAINFGCVCIAVALFALPAASRGAATAPAAPTLRDLLVHGTGEYLWAADVTPSDQPDAASVRTTVRFRTTGETQWRPAAQFEARAASLGSRGTELLVALENGEWMIVAEDGARMGMGLPGGADVLALAGAGDHLWAVAAAPPGSLSLPPPATQPAVTRAAATTRLASSTSPATTSAPRALPPHDLGLFRLKRGAWEEIDALPPKIRRDELVAAALLPVDRRLLLAVATEDLAVSVYWRSFDETAAAASPWQGDDKPVAVLPADGRLKLMSYHGRALLWLTGPDGLGRILVASAPDGADGAGATRRGDGWDPPIRIEPSPTLPAHFDRRALAVALGQLRLVATDGKGRIAEQVYSTEGKPAGPVTEAVAAPLPGDNRVAPMVEMLVLLVLFLSMIGAMRQRPNLAEAVRNIHRLHLAPLTRRFVGGVIDALPMLVCGYIGLAGTESAPPGAAPAVTWESPEVRWIAGGILLYLLHVTVLEALLARSIGKLITGTRVAALDGAVPRLSAILVRNLLRPLDVLLLVLLYLSPLRQRVGDMAAGTLVVLASPPPRETEAVDESPEPATKDESSDST